jgi:2-amino-4-hydroxy-6-hydroxymethyldihydropteridine diphosphokinase
MGRKRAEKWGPRLIDIDLLFHGSEVIDTKGLTLPHPGIPERKFVLAPLAEVAPDLEHPVLKKNVTQLLRECKDTLGVEKLAAHKT